MFVEINNNVYNVINIQNLIKSQDDNKYYITYIIKNGSSIVEEFDDESSRNSKCEEVEAAGGGGEQPVLIDKNINANGTYNASSDEADGYKKVVVDVPPTLYPDWSAIGYQGVPQSVIDDYNYSLEFKRNWVIPTSSLYLQDQKLAYMPLVDMPNYLSSGISFQNCIRLKEIPALTIKTAYLPDAFMGLNNLKRIDCSNWDISNATSLRQEFKECSQLEEVDFSNLTLNNITSMNSTFYGCTSIKKIDIRPIDLTKLEYYGSTFYQVKDDCLIIVKDQASKDWMATNFSSFTNVVTAEEYEQSQSN